MMADLLSPGLFDQANAVLWLFTAGAIGGLVLGAHRVVAGATRLAATLGLSEIIIGATVVSLGTTSPEVFVSVTGALEGKPGLALGNGVGSIICNTALVFGLGCLLKRLALDRFVLNRHGWVQLAAGILLTLTILALAFFHGGFDGVVMPRAVGFGYLLLLIGYLYLSVRWAREHPQVIRPEARVGRPGSHRVQAAFWHLVVLAVGLGLVAFCSHVLIGSVSTLCKRYGVPSDVLAVTVVAFGTSLPELVTALASIAKGHPELLVGNVLGANILNVLLVIGASSAAVPLRVPPLFFYLHVPVMIVVLVLLRLCISTSRETFRRWHGVPLLVSYASYYVLLLLVVKRFG